MSDMYAIKTSTLTALGDAVRKHVGETRGETIPFDYYEYNENNREALLNTEAGAALPIVENIYIPGAVKYKLVVNGVIGIPGNSSGTIGGALRYGFTDENGEKYVGDSSYNESFYDRACENSEFIISSRGDGNIYNRLTLYAVHFCYKEEDREQLQYDANIKVYGIDSKGEVIIELPIVVKNTMTLTQMAEKINALSGIPEEALVLTGNCGYRFAYGGWNWFIDTFGNRITTKDIINMGYMCSDSNINNIPFDFNINLKLSSLQKSLATIQSTGQPPLIKGELTTPLGNYSYTVDMDNLFYNSKFSSIPYDYFHNFGGEAFWRESKKYTSGSRQQIFYGCVNLRNLPDISMLLNASTSSYNNFYYGTFYYCHALDEAVNVPVANHCTYTSNMFSGMVDTVTRLKRFTFAVQEDGTPYVCNWKNQTIEFTKQVGYNPYNYGKYELFPQGKEVIDEATYNALKDDPDWHTKDINYARYNHDSAVETINSLPDCSSSGGANTIKFTGAQGALTDGGAINTLTDAEIAVAAAKGWTVSLV